MFREHDLSYLHEHWRESVLNTDIHPPRWELPNGNAEIGRFQVKPTVHDRPADWGTVIEALIEYGKSSRRATTATIILTEAVDAADGCERRLAQRFDVASLSHEKLLVACREIWPEVEPDAVSESPMFLGKPIVSLLSTYWLYGDMFARS